MFFILSSGRSGTKTLAQTLNQLDGIYCVHEPNPLLAVESSSYRYGKLSKEDLTKLLIDTRRPTINGKTYCESNQALSLIVPALIEAYPEARYIWLLRNGLDVIASTMQKQWYTGHSENFDQIDNSPPIQQEWIKGRINGDECGDIPKEVWEIFNRFEKCCWYWEYVNRVIESDLKYYTRGDYFIIRLENIRSELPILVDWMGLNVEKIPPIGKTNPAKRPPYHWKKWSDSERIIFEDRCGSLMSRFYPEWRSQNGIWNNVEYEIDPLRNQMTYAMERLKRSIRKINR